MVGVKDLLIQMDSHKSIVDRIRGVFSFVNIIMFVAVIGVVCTVGPCLVAILGPCVEALGRLLLTFIKERVAPILIFLHVWGVWELLSYMLIYLLIVQGCRYPPRFIDTGILIALMGALGFLPCWMYSTALWAPATGGDTSAFASLTNSMMCIILAPLALLLQSSVFGFLAVMALFAALGFSGFAFGLGFAVGWRSRDAMMQSFMASNVLLLLMIVVVVGGWTDEPWVKPFSRGLMVMGSIVHFLALLIMSSRYRWSFVDKKLEYVCINFGYLCSLILFAGLGQVFTAPALSNTAMTFFVLFVLEKDFELPWKGAGFIVPMFLTFVAMFFISMWLSTHPAFLVGLIDPSLLKSASV